MLALLFSLVACRGTTGPWRDRHSCQQIHEVGTNSCAMVAGLVIDSTGRPLVGAYVAVVGLVDSTRPVIIPGEFVNSDSAGQYSLRVDRMFKIPANSDADTLSVWVQAAVPPPPDAPIGTRGASGSVVVVLHWQPIGARPDTARAPTIAVPTSR